MVHAGGAPLLAKAGGGIPPALLVAIAAVEVGFIGYAWYDIARAPSVRSLPKWAWALICLLSPPLGCIAYLVAGRDTHRPGGDVQARPGGQLPPPATDSPAVIGAPGSPTGIAATGSPGGIEVHQLRKHFGPVLAVDGLDFTVRPGHVTGFLGPNGAGKTTTMRIILGLDAPTSGTALVGGRPYQRIIRPLHEVGSLLDADAVHPGRTARNHLLSVAQSNGISRRRVTEVLGLTGLDAVAGRRVRGFSLGMKQRLGIAGALLGDPPILMFDEPVNGLDPEGIHWIRELFKSLAAEGRTVFVSSHLMSEMALTADHLVIIGRGRLLADMPTDRFVESKARTDVLVRSPQAGDLARLLTAAGAAVVTESDGALAVTGMGAAAIGDLAAGQGIALHELVGRHASLEQAFLDITRESVDYRAGAPADRGGARP